MVVIEANMSETTNSFVIKPVCDNFKTFSYHERYLDALACLFAAVEMPKKIPTCAAITYYSKTGKFYLS